MPPIPSNKDQILALRAAQLEAGHGRNTRAQYRHWMLRYRRLPTTIPFPPSLHHQATA